MTARFRFLQTGDLHVGRGRVTWGEAESLHRARRMFDEIYATAHEQKCHAVLICGDIFDRKNVTNEERELVSRSLTLHAAKMPTFVISGNHDLKSHTNSNLDFLAEITENTDEIPNLHVSFAAKPSAWKAPVPEGAPDLFILGASVSMSESQAWVETWAQGLSGPDQFIFMGHGTVKGCLRNDALWKPSETDDRGLSLARAGMAPQVVWWAYGDIHKRQPLPTLPATANGWYAGTPIQMDFGEQPNRGVLIVALDWAPQTGWAYRGRRFVRLDDKGFTPLITVTKEEQIDSLPQDAWLRLSSDLKLPTERHAQVVKTLKVVEDWSTPAAAIAAAQSSSKTTDDAVSLEAFDPLLADLGAVEAEVLSGLPQGDNEVVRREARRVVSLAVERFRERTYVS